MINESDHLHYFGTKPGHFNDDCLSWPERMHKMKQFYEEQLLF